MLPARKITLIALTLILSNFAPTAAAETVTFQIPAPRSPTGHVRFDARIPKNSDHAPRPILILVPGYNGAGKPLLAGFWADFADRTGTILLAPTFRTNLEEIQSRTGYYYPSLWSGDVLLRAVEELATRTPADAESLFFYGHSAGAHFTHRFALWHPDRVAAFVAYSAAWWDPPAASIRDTPALIMCGEDDPRYEATLEFYLASRPFDAPWVWRGFRHTGHESTPAVLRLAATFLEHYLRHTPDTPLAGDIQTYGTIDWSDRESIPAEALTRLPTPAIAEIWKQEK
jgi:poly(3-hydroxybutyrate) depolymerase